MIKTVGEMISVLLDYPSDAPIGIARGLDFAPAIDIEKRSTSTKFIGMLDRFDGETGGPPAVILSFMNNSEISDHLENKNGR